MAGAGGAGAFVGGGGNATFPTTDAPDLVSATVNADNAFNARQAVTYCFDEALNTGSFAATANDFFVNTYDSDRVQRGNTTLAVPTDSKCVEVVFDNNVINFAEQGSLASVDDGAVTNLANRGNDDSSAPLTGSSLKQVAGQTTGPDLTAATPRQSDVTVEFTFDQEVDPANLIANRFNSIDNAGQETNGTAAVISDPGVFKKVRVTFPGGTDVANAIRFSVDQGAVRTLPQDVNLGGDNPGDATTAYTESPTGVVGTANSTRPVLTAAAPRVSGDSQFLLTYSGDLGNYTPAGVFAVMDNGRIEAATGAQSVQGSTTQKVVSFPADGIVDSEPSAVVAMVSTTGAATTLNGNQPSPASEVNVGPGAPSLPGYTTGPDLLKTNIDDTADQAGFTFDEPVDPSSFGTAADYDLLVANGSPLSGQSQAGTTGDRLTVIVSYAGDVAAGVGVALDISEILDNEGNDAPRGSVSTTLIPLPPDNSQTPIPTTTAPPTPAPTVAPTQGPGTDPVRRKGKIRGIKSPGRRVKGKISVAGRTCKTGRRVVIKKGKKTVGAGRTKRNGSFNIKTRKHKKGKLVVQVRRKSTAGTICAPIKKRVPGRN